MKAEKNNKVYAIDESMKSRYLADGFDIKDDEGNLLESAKGKTVSYEEYQKVVNELEALKSSNSEVPDDELSKMTVDELKVYAEEHGVDIGNASSQSGIIKKISEALKSEQ